ncbi:MAG: hypothetical protein O9248_01885 [Rhodobacteraceae bacterium]|nr:hypothetical protein [Paracoccaceae bacterium]
MSHDIEAAFASAEIVNALIANPSLCFSATPAMGSLSGHAGKEGRVLWPHADGAIELVVSGASPKEYTIAVEYKRPNEGLHGVLTAIGQAHAYLEKGFDGSIIVVPESYPGLSSTGPYVKAVLDGTSQASEIGVVTYKSPDLSRVSPFSGKLAVARNLIVDGVRARRVGHVAAKTTTQWAHVREGSTDPDAFFKYLQCIKALSGGKGSVVPAIPAHLATAVSSIDPAANVVNFLSYTLNNSLPDRAWRDFWFTYILNNSTLEGWTLNAHGAYQVNDSLSSIVKIDGSGNKAFFVGRVDSVKNKLVDQLNAGKINHSDACIELVRNYRARAHSYREDIDSGCEHMGFIDSQGRLTDLGFSFVEACERYGDPNSGVPKEIFVRAVLTEGGFAAFLHYVYRLSNDLFHIDPTRFASGRLLRTFDQNGYLSEIEDQMANSLKVLKKGTIRGGASRKPFQGELALLRNLGLVGRFRAGTGLLINWPTIQEAMSKS